MQRLSLSLSLSLLTGCSDYTLTDAKEAAFYPSEPDCFNEIDDDLDGLADEDDPDCFNPDVVTDFVEAECVEMTLYGHGALDWGWAGNGCWGTLPADRDLLFAGTDIVDSAEIVGTGAYPGSATPVRAVQLLWANSGYPGNSANLASDDVLAVGSTGDWTASISGSALGAFQSGPGSRWWPAVEIQDSARAAAETCDEDYPLLEFCASIHDVSAARKVPDASTCEAGSGTFRLVPRRLVDHDADLNYAAIFDAVMVSGTGTPTNAAWIRTARVANSASLGFRIVKVNRSVVFNAADALSNAAAVSAAIGGTTLNFPPGVLSGGAPWVLSEVNGSTSMNPTVELSWECATPTEYEETSASLGFTFKPSDLGCSATWLQRFTIRPHPAFNPSWLQVQPYGNSVLSKEVPVRDLGNGTWQVLAKINGLDIAGTIEDIDANQGMVVNLDQVRFAGQQVCGAGTYPLPSEE